MHKVKGWFWFIEYVVKMIFPWVVEIIFWELRIVVVVNIVDDVKILIGDIGIIGVVNTVDNLIGDIGILGETTLEVSVMILLVDVGFWLVVLEVVNIVLDLKRKSSTEWLLKIFLHQFILQQISQIKRRLSLMFLK